MGVRLIGCPIHDAIIDLADQHLTLKGSFEKCDILEKLNFKGIGDGINWCHIRDELSKRHNTMLIPVAQRFFSRRPGASRVDSPEKFVATGYGKKTAGFALVTEETKHIAGRHNGILQARVAQTVTVLTQRTEELATSGIATDLPEVFRNRIVSGSDPEAKATVDIFNSRANRLTHSSQQISDDRTAEEAA